MELTEQKRKLRTEVRAAERALTQQERADSDQRITKNVLMIPAYREAGSIFCFVGSSREIDTTGILLDALRAGKRLCVPLCTGDGIMELREIHSLEELHKGAYGILEPDDSTPQVDFSEVSLSIIPCVSCSKAGYRLGQGGGYYDRFFAKGTEKTVLLCREKLMRESVPREAHDVVFPVVLTERGIYRNGSLQEIE